MKKLKNYIKNYIDESVWDIENNIDDDNKEFALNEVKKFIEDNYEHININRCEIVFDWGKNKYVVNCNQSISLKLTTNQLTNGLFEWRLVRGDFNCFECPIITLQGAPEYVGGGFYCSSCPITSLQGAPKTVDGTFDCSYCEDLSSLEGAPKEVGENFYCQGCPNLHSLDGIGKVKGIIVNDIKNK